MEWPAPCLCYSHALCFSAFLHSFAKNSTDTRRLHRQTHNSLAETWTGMKRGWETDRKMRQHRMIIMSFQRSIHTHTHRDAHRRSLLRNLYSRSSVYACFARNLLAALFLSPLPSPSTLYPPQNCCSFCCCCAPILPSSSLTGEGWQAISGSSGGGAWKGSKGDEKYSPWTEQQSPSLNGHVWLFSHLAPASAAHFAQRKQAVETVEA